MEQNSGAVALQNNRSFASNGESDRGHNKLPPPTSWKAQSVSRGCDKAVGTVYTFTRPAPTEQRTLETRRPQEAQNVKDEVSEEDNEEKTKSVIDEFLHNSDLEKLEFTTKQAAEPAFSEQTSPEELKQRLQRLLRNHQSNEEIFSRLKRHLEGEISPPMYRALVTLVYQSVITGSGLNCELNTKTLKRRMGILGRCKDANRNLELHTIFALQSLMNKLDHPKGILREIFELAYNEDLLSDYAFKQWEL